MRNAVLTFVTLAMLALSACGVPEGAGSHENYATGQLDLSAQAAIGHGYRNETIEGYTIGFTVLANEIAVTFDGCDVSAPYLGERGGVQTYGGGSSECADRSVLELHTVGIQGDAITMGFERDRYQYPEDESPVQAISFSGTY